MRQLKCQRLKNSQWLTTYTVRIRTLICWTHADHLRDQYLYIQLVDHCRMYRIATVLFTYTDVF